MTDTIFSKIVRGEIPCARVLETDQAIAFLDINPLNPGHVLLIPKEPYATLSDLPDNLSAHLGSLLPRLCRAVREATGAEALNIVANHGRVAGQTVDHFHWHIIPRFSGDPIRWPWPQRAYRGNELEQMQAKMEQALKENAN